ncbi:MAG: hypothetical protein Q9168_004808 [Polycauliona sp. 1 TL-2023]
MSNPYSNPSTPSDVQEENDQLQAVRLGNASRSVQERRTHTIKVDEAERGQELREKELDYRSGAPSPTGSSVSDDDAHDPAVDLIDSLSESGEADRLDQLGDALDVIDTMMDHGRNETLKDLSTEDRSESHNESGKNKDFEPIDPTGHHSNLLGLRGGLGDSASQHSGEGDTVGGQQDYGNEHFGEPDPIHYLEYTPERQLSDDGRDDERDEFPWRTWSNESTLIGSPSVQEDNASHHSIETQSSDFPSDFSTDEDEESEEPQQAPIHAVTAERRRGHEFWMARLRQIANEESRAEIRARDLIIRLGEEFARRLATEQEEEAEEERQEDLRALAEETRRFAAEDPCPDPPRPEHGDNNNDEEEELPNYAEAFVIREESTSPPPPPYHGNRVLLAQDTITETQSSQPPPSRQPTVHVCQPHPLIPQSSSQQPPISQIQSSLQMQPLQTHAIQALALLGEDLIRALSVEVRAVLGEMGIVVGEAIAIFRQRRREEEEAEEEARRRDGGGGR